MTTFEQLHPRVRLRKATNRITFLEKRLAETTASLTQAKIEYEAAKSALEQHEAK